MDDDAVKRKTYWMQRMEDPMHLHLSKEAQGQPEGTHQIRCAPGGRTFPTPHHHVLCRHYPGPSRERGGSLGFKTREDAIAAGHPPCVRCKRFPYRSQLEQEARALGNLRLKPGDRSRAIHPKRVGERMSPEARKQDIERKRRARRDMTPIEYEKYLHKERERHRERRRREREG